MTEGPKTKRARLDDLEARADYAIHHLGTIVTRADSHQARLEALEGYRLESGKLAIDTTANAHKQEKRIEALEKPRALRRIPAPPQLCPCTALAPTQWLWQPDTATWKCFTCGA